MRNVLMNFIVPKQSTPQKATNGN